MTQFSLSPASTSEPSACKAIVFKAARYWLALPIAAVLKVINFPPEMRTVLNDIGFVSLGDRAISLLDIEQTLKTGQGQSVGRFLIVVQLSERQLCAIPVDEPPTLGEIDFSRIRQLRSRATASTSPLNLTSHIAPIRAEKEFLEVFLLDLEKLARVLV